MAQSVEIERYFSRGPQWAGAAARLIGPRGPQWAGAAAMGRGGGAIDWPARAAIVQSINPARLARAAINQSRAGNGQSINQSINHGTVGQGCFAES